jgi:hypothetical protein
MAHLHRAAVLLLCLVVAGPAQVSLSAPLAGSGGDTSRVSGTTSVATPDSGVIAACGQLPSSFEANQGQADPAVDFVAHGQGYTAGAHDLGRPKGTDLARIVGHFVPNQIYVLFDGVHDIYPAELDHRQLHRQHFP